MIILRQKGSQEDGLEGFPHNVEAMKPVKGGGAQYSGRRLMDEVTPPPHLFGFGSL